MAQLSVVKISHGDDQAFEAVTADLAAGVLVIPSTAPTVSGLQGIVVATDAAINVVGVSSRKAVIASNQAGDSSGTEGYGYPFVDASVPAPTLTVYRRCVLRVTYTAAAVAYGTKLCAAAGGSVRAWVTGTDAVASIIGECANPGGVGSGGGVAKALIY